MILPILDPAISQKRARLLFFSFFSRTSLTRWDPLRAMTAMSEVGSRMGITAWLCLVKDTRPSRNGGLVSCTIRTARTSLSLLKSVSTCSAQRSACQEQGQALPVSLSTWRSSLLMRIVAGAASACGCTRSACPFCVVPKPPVESALGVTQLVRRGLMCNRERMALQGGRSRARLAQGDDPGAE